MITHALEIMLAELESHQLQVCLVPLNPQLRGYNEGGMKRVCCDRNPLWYRQLCARHLSSRIRNHRKPDTKLKRQNVLRALRRMQENKYHGKYEQELRSIARQQKAA